jgi:uncharacterized UBP type Zn finger protein
MSKASGSGDVTKDLMKAGMFLAKKGKQIDDKYHVASQAKSGLKTASKQAVALNKKHDIASKSKKAMSHMQAAFTTENVPSERRQQREQEKYDQRAMGMASTAANNTRDAPAPASSCKPDEKKVTHLMEMGFDRQTAGEALSRHNNNLVLAGNQLLDTK